MPPIPKPWIVPKIYPGRQVAIVGGGPTVNGIDLNLVKDHPTIAVNNAFILTPWAEYCYFHDRRWLGWVHIRRELVYFRGSLVTGTTNPPAWPHCRVFRVEKDRRPPGTEALSEDPKFLTGRDSGLQAINLAFHFGAKRIVLIGFDMGFKEYKDDNGVLQPGCHWHEPHPIPSKPNNYKERFLPQYGPAIKWLAERGVDLVWATPTAVTEARVIPLEKLYGKLHPDSATIATL